MNYSELSVNSGVVNLVSQALNETDARQLTVDVPRDALVRVVKEFSRVRKLLAANSHEQLAEQGANLVRQESDPTDAKPGKVERRQSVQSELSAVPTAEGLWDTSAVARFLNVSLSWVRHRTADGSMPFVRVGGWLVRFEPEVIRAWAQQDGAGSIRKLRR